MSRQHSVKPTAMVINARPKSVSPWGVGTKVDAVLVLLNGVIAELTVFASAGDSTPVIPTLTFVVLDINAVLVLAAGGVIFDVGL